MENSQIAEVFDEIADLLDLQEGNQFRIRSYRNAARTVRDLSQRLEDMVEHEEDLTELPNIGDSTAEKIHDILERGTCETLEDLRQEVPSGLTEVMKVPQLGPRKAMKLYEAIGVESLEELRETCEKERVREVEGFGAKSEQNILQGIEQLEKTLGRFLLRDAADFVEALSRHLEDQDAVERWEVAGSFRRRKETIGDLDVLVQADERERANEQILNYDPIDEVMSRGEEKVSVRLDSGLQIDFRYFEPESFGSALMYFTGSKAHNIAVRQRAVDRDWKLNEYGLFKDDNRLAGETEEAVYHRLNMSWVPPELREDRGEVEAAEKNELPELLTLEDVRGDLQAHTDRTDGSNTLEEMAEGARERGYEYLAITDHSQRVTMARGLDQDALREHAERVRQLNEQFDDFWLLAGIEVDILKDGSLDLGPEALRELDWVLATVHYNLEMDQDKMTERILRGLDTGAVHCFGHPTSRIIGEREPISCDLDRIFELCAERDIWIEINAQPDRLDLSDVHCQRALEMGLGFTISTDAHKLADLDFMKFGVNVARRGWLRKEDVLNTCSADELRDRLRRD